VPPAARPARRAFDLRRYDSVQGALADATLQYRSNPFLVETDRDQVVARRTYREHRDAAARLARALAARGIGPGERVAIAMGNGPRWLAAATAALHLGAVLVPLDARLDGAGLAALVGHARPRALLADEPVWRRVRAAGGAAELVAAWHPEGRTVSGGAVAWPDLLEAGGPGPLPEPAPRGREEPAAVVYSSGTGGRPKGCVLTHGAYLSQMEALANLYPLEEDDVYLSVLPTHHALDFMCGFLVPVLCGARVVHLRTLRPEHLVWACRDQGVTHMSAVPALLEALERRLRERTDGLEGVARAGLDGLRRLNAWLTRVRPRPAVSRALLYPVHRALGGRLRTIFAGGAMVPATTARALYDLGLPVAIGYGLTEAGAVVTVNDLDPFRADTVGRPVAGTEIEVRDPDADGAGEVWVRGPQVFAGYLDDPEATAEVLVDGWLRTGDLGRLDAAGHLRLVGRRKDVIVTAGGKNVHPADVEGRFAGLEAEELAVLAAHTVWPSRPGEDERLIGVVRPRAGAEPADLRRRLGQLNRRLPGYQRLGGVLVVEAPFPRTTSLKLKRAELARDLGGRFRPAAVEAL